MAMPTLLDIAKHSGVDGVVGLIEESIQTHPEVSGRVLGPGGGTTIPNMGGIRTIRGTQYKTLIRTEVPTVAFRHANEGVAPTKEKYENRLIETFILNARWQVDRAVAAASEDGPAVLMALAAQSMLEGTFRTLAKQFYYGTGTGDAKGHPGLIDSVNTDQVVDATGTTASTGSSVWAIKWGVQDVKWVYGQGGALDVEDPRIETINDPNDATKQLTVYLQELLAYPGLQVGNKYCLGRIKKLTADSGKGLTDALLYALLEKFPAGVVPDVLMMTRRSHHQLRASRTATNATGAPAPFPGDFEGIPIATTDSLLNTEALTL